MTLLGGQSSVGDSSGSVGPAKYYTWDGCGNLSGVYDAQMSPLWLKTHGMDAPGNPQEGPGGSSGSSGSSGYWGNAPPTPLVGDGSYLNPATGYRNGAYGGLGSPYDEGAGDVLDELGNSQSGLAYLHGAARYGWKETTSHPAWRPGSPERQFDSQNLQMIPALGTLYTGYTVITGQDPVAGTCLSTQDRILGGLLLAAKPVSRILSNSIPVQLELDFPGLPPSQRGNIRWHHPYPKYLGGAANQSLVGLPKWYHDAIHKMFDQQFPRWRSTAVWMKIRGTTPAQQAQFDAKVWRALSQVYKTYPLTNHPITGAPFPWR